MFKKVTVKLRLIFVIALLGIELVIGAAVGLISLHNANSELQSLYADRLVALGDLDQIIRKMNLNQLALARALTTPADRIPALLAEVEHNTALVDDRWKSYSATKMTKDEGAKAELFLQSRAKFVDEGLRPAVNALRAGNTAAATEIVHGSMLSLFEPVRTHINELIQSQLDEAAAINKRSEKTYEIVQVVCLSGMTLGLILSAVVGTMLIRSIVHPLEEAIRIAGAVASGDLTQHIDTSALDETGRLMRALKEMNEGLASIVGRVRTGTDMIATASSQIAAGNNDLSGRTEMQAASLKQTASSMDELTSTVKQNAENARQANTLALTASTVAAKGGAVVSEVVSTMGEINTSATKIADIIGVIDGIAFQTNILALNAAVEAARAGEQGRGFAVVASEVRNLAQRSAAAAKEIKSLIDDSVLKVHHGAELADRAGSTMREIVQSVDRVTGIMSQILSASQEQSAGIEQVNLAIAKMDQSTQQNAALVEEASAAAHSLQEEAEELGNTVGTFKIAGASTKLSNHYRSLHLL